MPKFKLKSQHSQPSLSQQSVDEEDGVIQVEDEQQNKESVTGGRMLNKKRTYDQITKASSTETAPGGKEISLVDHVRNSFKKLKIAREDKNESSD